MPIPGFNKAAQLDRDARLKAGESQPPARLNPTFPWPTRAFDLRFFLEVWDTRGLDPAQAGTEADEVLPVPDDADRKPLPLPEESQQSVGGAANQTQERERGKGQVARGLDWLSG